MAECWELLKEIASQQVFLPNQSEKDIRKSLMIEMEQLVMQAEDYPEAYPKILKEHNITAEEILEFSAYIETVSYDQLKEYIWFQTPDKQ